MPEFKDRIMKSPDYVDPTVAHSLYNIWSTGAQSSDDKIFKKPVTLSQNDVLRMKDSGLILAIGDNLQITDKGQKVIKTMLLGDDRSIFEDDGNVVPYNTALNNVKEVKTAKQHRIACNFWDQFEEDK